MLVTVDHTEAFNAIRESLRTQLERHGYHLTDKEIDDVSRNVSQAVVLLDPETK